MIICLGTTPTVQQTMRFERIKADAVNRAVETFHSPSGKSVNAARVARALGGEVLAMGFWGGDTGAFLLREIESAGVAHDFVEVAPRTRTCVTAIDSAAGTATELVEESAAVDPAAYEELLDRLRRRVGGDDVVVLSGSLPPGAPVDFYGRCVAIAQQAGARTIVDAVGPALLHAVQARPTLAKPNASELGITLGLPVGDESQIRAGIDRLLDLGAQQAVVTRGAAAVLFGQVQANGERRFGRIVPPAVKVVSPIGSGDSMAAGMAVDLHRGGDIDAALRLGVAMGCANAARAGAGLFDWETADQVLRELGDAEL